jgi:hypothetical protein
MGKSKDESQYSENDVRERVPVWEFAAKPF